MIKMAQLEDIRKMYFMEELSIREISRRTGHHRDTIAKYLDLEVPQPPKYNLSKEKPHPVLGAFIPIIEEILRSDESKPRKQRHTIRRIFERLKEEYGYTGGYSTITQYIREGKIKKKEAFVPLEFELGAHGEVDWGEARFYLNGKETKAYLFVMRLGASKGFYVRAYPFEKQEAFFDGHRRCFEFMGGVPYEITYDNLKTAVKNILKGHQREEQDQFIALRTHYLYNANFSRPAVPDHNKLALKNRNKITLKETQNTTN